jgi:hypothetical protein
MKIALLTGPSGSGKTFVLRALPDHIDRLSYDHVMRDSLKHAFPQYIGDQWDKGIWHDNRYRLDLREAFRPAFKWSGESPLCVEGYQLREKIWRKAILDLAHEKGEVSPKLFVIQPKLNTLMEERAKSGNEYHRKHADAGNCIEALAHHEKMYLEQPFGGAVDRFATKDDALKGVLEFLSIT